MRPTKLIDSTCHPMHYVKFNAINQLLTNAHTKGAYWAAKFSTFFFFVFLFFYFARDREPQQVLPLSIPQKHLTLPTQQPHAYQSDLFTPIGSQMQGSHSAASLAETVRAMRLRKLRNLNK